MSVSGVKRVLRRLELTVERFGRFTRPLQPGVNLMVAVRDQFGTRINMMEQVLD